MEHFYPITCRLLFILLSSFFIPSATFAADSNFPAPDSLPNLQYQPLTTVFPDPTVLSNTQDMQGALESLRRVSSATPEFERDLLLVVQNAQVLDSAHLALIADGAYFPWMSFQSMVQFISDPHVCEQISYHECQVKLDQVRKNESLAADLGQSLNQILASGLSHLHDSLSYIDGLELLQRAFPSSDPLADSEVTNQIFKKALSLLPPLTPDQKFHLMRLAQKKSAYSAAKEVAVSWFTADSDHEAGTLINLLNSFPSALLRDAVFFETISTVKSLTNAQTKLIILLSQDRLKTALYCLKRQELLTPSDVTDIVALLTVPEDRNQWLSASIQKLGSISAEDVLTIVRVGSPVSASIASQALKSVSNLNGTQLSQITESVSYGPGRDQLILDQLQRIVRITPKEGNLLTAQASTSGLHIVLLALKKIPSPQVSDLVTIVEALHYGRFRDLALLEGSKAVVGADLPSIQAALKQAYGEKVQLMTLLVVLLPHFSTVDLASLALDLYTGSLRDQILMSGTKFVNDLNISGLIAMVNQADQEKYRVALSIFSRMNQLSARDLGIVLKVIADGGIRDQVISAVLPMIKKVDGIGASMVVAGTLENTVYVAMLLIKMIPSVTGMDLDKILSVCGSGVIRDQILIQGIPLLGSITKEEAKALHRRAYNNKDNMAILLMGKVTDFDGNTIAEMAMLSGKAASRDLIIAEGLKHLKQVDAVGLIAMIKVADKMVEKLAFEVVIRIPHFSLDNSLDILDVLPPSFKDRFLIRSVDLLEVIDEPAITQLALATKDQATRDEIVRKGVDRLGDGE